MQTQAAQFAAQGGTAPTFAQYCTLLAGATQAYDIAQSQPPAKTAHRQVFELDSHPAPDLPWDPYGSHQDVDTPVDDLLINAHQRRGPSLNGTQWHKLTPSDQKLWDQFSQESKEVILTKPDTKFAPRKRDFGRSSGSRQQPSQRPPLQANAHDISLLHDITAYEYLSHFQDSYELPEDVPPEVPPDDDPPPGLFAHMTKKSAMHPADVARVLSQTMAKAGTASPPKKEFTHEGKIYR